MKAWGRILLLGGAVLLSTVAFAAPGAFRRAMIGRLPAKLRSIEPGKTTASDIEALLGEPLVKEGDTAFYSLTGFKYDTAVEYSGNLVNRLEFFPYNIPFNFGDLTRDANQVQLTKLPRSESVGDESLREVYLEAVNEGVRIHIREGGRRPVSSFEILAIPSKGPSP